MVLRAAFLLFAAGWGANHFAALLVVYKKELGLSASALGVLFGAYALGLVPGLILAGRASDTRGRRALVLPASALAIAASAVLAFGANGFPALLAGRLMFGLAMGCIMSPGSVWVQELSSAEHGPRRATLALSAGFGLGPVASGVIAEVAPSPMVLPYVVHAIVMAIALVAARSVPETAPTLAPIAANVGAKAAGVGPRERAVLFGLVPVAPWAFGFVAVTIAIVPGILRPSVTRPVVYSASVIAATLLAGVLVQPLTNRIGRRADLVGLASGAMGTALAGYAVAILSPTLVFGAALLSGAGYGLVITTGLREIAERVAKRERGSVVGIYYVLTYVGFALPFVHAVAARRVGDAATLYVVAATALACLVVRAAMTSART